MKRNQLLVSKAASQYILLAIQNHFFGVAASWQITQRHFKQLSFALLLLTVFSSLQAQRGAISLSGSRSVGFNIDGDTKTGYNKFSVGGYAAFDDDWFKALNYGTPHPSLGKGVFDVSDSATRRAQLQANPNQAFSKRMAGFPYDISIFMKDYATNDIDTNFLVDGVYFRDYYNNDNTAFTSAAKNGQSPNLWQGGLSNVGAKADIIDAFTHVRTSGLNPAKDSAWFFAGVSTKGTDGARYFDIEVYRESISFNEVANGTGINFVSAGTSYGHSKWELNSSGNVTRTGDIIISVEYTSGNAPDIDFRIWLAKTTYDSITTGKLLPKTFKLNGRWNIADDGQHGYAEITGESTGEIWGSGLGNFGTASANSDTTYSTPWGTVNTNGVWSQTYDQLQFVEIGLNFSRFGMNPFQYVTSYCTSPYNSILVKSRASPAFDANLIDFVGPINFTVKEAAPYTVGTDTLTCSQPIGRLPFRFSARNYYRLLNSTGDTLAKDVDFRTATSVADLYLPVTKSGTYRVEATNFMGCPTLNSTSVTVYVDSTAPVAKAFLSDQVPQFYLNGVGEGTSSTTISNAPSQNLSYSWTGPDGFTSNEEDPKLGNSREEIKTGNYTLTVAEGRNGCTASSMIYVDASTLALNGINLKGKVFDDNSKLDWNVTDMTDVVNFEIERSSNGSQFIKVGQAGRNNGIKQYSFTDNNMSSGTWHYRIKAKLSNGQFEYSNPVILQINKASKFNVTRQQYTNRIALQLKTGLGKEVHVKVLSMNGSLILQETYPASQPGTRLSTIQTILLPETMINQPVIIALYEGNTLLEAKKL